MILIQYCLAFFVGLMPFLLLACIGPMCKTELSHYSDPEASESKFQITFEEFLRRFDDRLNDRWDKHKYAHYKWEEEGF